MLELLQNFQTDMASGAAWVPIWVNVMGAILLLAIPFSFVRVEARWVLLGVLAGGAMTLFLYSQFGYQRVLGLGHMLFWTPVLIYLFKRRTSLRIAETWSGKWLALAGLTIATSLVFDYSDFFRSVFSGQA